MDNTEKEKKEFCTGVLYPKIVHDHKYFVIYHPDGDPCSLHNDAIVNLEHASASELQGVRIAIDNYELSLRGSIEEDKKSDIDQWDIEPKLPIPLAVLAISLVVSVYGYLNNNIWLSLCLVFGLFSLSYWLIKYIYFSLADEIEKENMSIDKARSIHKKREKRKDKLRVVYAKHILRRRLVNAMGRAGVAFRSHRQGNRTYYKKPRISKPYIEQDVIKYQIQRFPPMISPSIMLNPEIISMIEYEISRDIIVEQGPEKKYFVNVGLKSGYGGIKKRFLWYDESDPMNVLDMLPKNTFRMAVPLGLGERRRMIWVDITDPSVNHILVAGSTGSGKSNFINQVLCTLMLRNTPKQLKLVMVDLKLVELTNYETVPHLMYPIAKNPESMNEVLEGVVNEMMRRYTMMQGKARNIKSWNLKYGSRKLPYIVVLMDELAEGAEADKKWKKNGEAKVRAITRLGRAAGIHFIGATQVIKKEILSMFVTANIPTRICYRVGTMQASMLVVNNGDAYRIPPIVGRAVAVTGAERQEIQTSFISDRQVLQTIAKVKEGVTYVDPGDEYTIYDLLLYVLESEDYDGRLPITELQSDDKIPESKYWIANVCKEFLYSPDDRGPIIDQIPGYELTRFIILPHRYTRKHSDKARVLYPLLDDELPQTLEELKALREKFHTNSPIQRLRDYKKQNQILKDKVDKEIVIDG